MSTKKTAKLKRVAKPKSALTQKPAVGKPKPPLKSAKTAAVVKAKTAVPVTALKSAVPTNGAKAQKVIELKSTTVSVKVEEFKSGDKVVYPAHGVGAVDSIQARVIGGSEAKFYMITILETGMKVMVPVSQATTVGLRKIVDAKTVEKVYDILRDKDVIVQQQTWNRRFREYTQKLKTGSVFEIAKVIRDLSVLKSDKELSFGERKMLDTAQGLLVKELSIAKARSEEMIRAELQKICDA